MHVILLILAAICAVGSIACWFIILVDAFRYETWAGLIGFFFAPYLMYWAIWEFEHDYKWPIALGYLLGGTVAGGFFLLAMGRPL